MIEFVLASGSPRRSVLLDGMGVDFIVIKPEIDESVHDDETPHNYVQRLSREKAEAVAEKLLVNAFVLAADTTVIHDGEILGKPADEDEARRMLLRLRGHKHEVCTGFTLLHYENGTIKHTITRIECSTVQMRFYAASEMENWINTGHAFDKAGAYAIQDETFAPVEAIQGSYNNIVGLPTETLETALQEIGYRPNNQS
ncbi:MAG: Maf family protein [Chloroflexota bacterium]